MIKVLRSWENLKKTFRYLCVIIGKRLHMLVENLLRFEEQHLVSYFSKTQTFPRIPLGIYKKLKWPLLRGLASKNISHPNKIGSIFYFLFYEDLLESVSCSMKWFNNRRTRTTERGVCGLVGRGCAPWTIFQTWKAFLERQITKRSTQF